MSGTGLRGPLERAARSAAKRALGGAVRRWTSKRHDLPLSLWRLDRDAGGELRLDGIVLGDLLARFGSPLHVVDATRLASNIARFTARPPGASRACEVFYSYKTNPVPELLRSLAATGIGADVASAYELWLALRLGIDPAHIVYNGPEKSEESLRLAMSRGIALINANTRSELAKIASVARTVGARPAIGIRVVVPGSIGGQFGERIDNGAALAAFEEALRHPELRVVAIHSHVNGEIASVATLDALLSHLFAFADVLEDRLGVDLEILDVGGNLACPTVSHVSQRDRRLAMSFGREPLPRAPEAVLTIDAYVERLIGRVERHFAARNRHAPRVFVEPGRAMTGNAQMLLCKVASLREPDDAGMTWAVLDAGLNVADPLRNEIHQFFALRSAPNAPERLYRLMGPSCTLADQLVAACRLPELSVGDGIAIMDSGAYFVPFATCFSRPRPAVVRVSHGSVDLLRRAETFDDLAALEDEP